MKRSAFKMSDNDREPDIEKKGIRGVFLMCVIALVRCCTNAAVPGSPLGLESK
jgi:hypothetical protein